MYKFICANITKPRHATNSYRKLTHTKKIHQDSSRPQSANMKEYLDENPDETQEYNEEENGGQENPGTSTSPSRMQNFAMASKLPTFKTLQPTPALKMKEYPKFYTGNFVIVDPPSPSISKKYYHIYSISPSSITKRPYSSSSCKKFLTEDARENYKKAMENIYSIQKQKSDFQFKVMNISNKVGSPSTDIWMKKVAKKKVPEIRYPTHTIKHNLTLTKRYKIREGSAERKIRALEEKFKLRKKLQSKSFKSLNVKKVTYPQLVENFKKVKINVAPIRPENKNEVSYEANTAKPVIHVVKNKPPRQEVSQQIVGPTLKRPYPIGNINEVTRPDEQKNKLIVEREYSNIDKDFETLVKSHPTIENASKEVKMKLKTKFIQLLLKTAKSSVRKPKTEVIPAETTAPKEETIEAANTTEPREEKPVAKEPLECKKEISEKYDETPEQHSETPNIICHPRSLDAATRQKDYMRVRYPKRVWVDDDNTYDLDDICIKDNSTRTGTGLITNNYAKESPKPNYKKVEEEARELSKFVNKFKNIDHKSNEIILKLKKGGESSDGTSTKLEELKKARLNYIKELEKLNVKLTAANLEIDAKETMTNDYRSNRSATDQTLTHADDRKADCPKSINNTHCDYNQKRNSNRLRKREDLAKIRKILTGEMRREGISSNKKSCETKETKRNINNPQTPNKEPRQATTNAEPEVKMNVWKDKRMGQRIFYKNRPNRLNQKSSEIVNLSDSVNRMNNAKGKRPHLESTNKDSLGYPNKIDALNTTEEYVGKQKHGHNMPKTQTLNRSEEVLDEPLEMGKPFSDALTEQTFKCLNKLDIQKNILCKKFEPAQELVEKTEVRGKDTDMDITHTYLKIFKADQDEDVKEDTRIVQAKTADDTLDEVTTIDELNERAKEAEERFQKRKSRQEERKKVQMEREKMKTWPSNKTLNITPRIDKVDDYKDEQYQRGEDAKRKIEQLVPEVHTVRHEVTTEYEKLNDNAERLIKKSKNSNWRYSLDQPEVKPQHETRMTIHEADLKTEQDQQVKEESDEFYRNEKEESNVEILEGEELEEIIKPQNTQKQVPKDEDNFQQKKENEDLTLEEKTQYEELNETAEKLIRKRPNKGYTMEHPLVERPSQRKKRMIQTNDLNKIKDRKVNDNTSKEITEEDNVDAKSALKDDSTLAKQGNNQSLRPEESDSHKIKHKEGHHGYALYPSHHKTGVYTDVASDKTELKPNQGEVKSRESPPAVHPNVMKTSSAALENEERSTYFYDENIHTSKPKGFEGDVDLEKQTKHLRKAVEAMESRKIVSPIIQADRDMKYSKNERTPTDEYKEEVLQKYFEPKLLPGTDQTVYTPKERLIVNNIEEVDDNDGKMELGQGSKSVSDTAVLRRGDEIIIFEKNPRPKEMLTAAETNLFHMQLLDKALSIRNEGAITENKLLLDTKSKIDEMVDKINSLESILKQKQALKQEEQKSENKPRIPPPKPPTEKDRKDIKKDKPKGPNDMVLPPKIRGSTPEKRPKGHKETEKCAADQGEALSLEKEKPVESQTLESPGNMKLKSNSELNLEPKSANQTQNVTKEIRDDQKIAKDETEGLRKEKIAKDISTEKKDKINAKDKHENQGKTPVKNNEKDDKTTNKMLKKDQMKAKEDTMLDRAFYDPHAEKVRKYFARKYGLDTKSHKSKELKRSHAGEVGTRPPESKMQSRKSTDTKTETPKLPKNKVQMQKLPENKKIEEDASEAKVEKSLENKAEVHKLSENKTQLQEPPDNKPKTQKPPETKMQMKKPPEDKSQSPKPPENRPPSPPQKPPENNMQVQGPPANKMQMQKLPDNKMQTQQLSENKQQAQKPPYNLEQEQKVDAIKVSFVKKIVKTPKSKSLTRAERNSNEMVLHPTKSASHLDKVRQKSFEANKPVRSSTTIKASTRTSSSRPQLMKIGMRGTKTKYSSWSTQGRTGRQINSPLETKAILKKIASDETIPSPWGSPNRSASGASRRAGGPRKPIVLMNNNYLRRSVSKDRSEDERRSPLEKTKPNSSSAKEKAVSKQRDVVSQPVIYTRDKLKQSNAEPSSHVQEEKAKRKKQVIELAKVLPENDNVKQEEQVPDLSKAVPKIFWADTNVRPQSQMSDKHLKQVKPIIELSKVLPKSSKSENAKQEKNIDKNTDLHLLASKRLTESSTIRKKTISKSPKLSSSYTTPELCSADNNLKQDKPVGTLNIRLPNSDRKNYLSSSAERNPGRGTKLPGYSSETKVLTSKKNPKLTDVMDLDNSENKMSIAGISTTPTVKALDDKHFSGPRKSIDQITEGIKIQKLPQEEKKDKTAIFRIQYDGEVFIIKKADESLSEAIDKKKKEQTLSNINSMDGSTEPITELKQKVQHSTDLNREDIVILEKYNTMKQNDKLKLENKQSGQLEGPSKLSPTKSASINHRDSAKSDAKRPKQTNIRSAEDSKPKLTAKVEEIIVKPMKDKDSSHNEDGHTEKVIFQQSSIRTDPILKKYKPKGRNEDLTLKQSLKDKAKEAKLYNSAQGKKPSMLPQQKQNARGITQETNLLPELKECAHHDTLQVPSNNAKANSNKKDQIIQQATILKSIEKPVNVEDENRNTMHYKTEPETLNSAKNKDRKNLETSSTEFTKFNNIYISKTLNATNTTPENESALSNLPSNASTPKSKDRPLSVKETPNLTTDPSKDITYNGTVKLNCVEKSEIQVKETTKKNDMYNLNVSKTNPHIPVGSLYTIRVPDIDNDLHDKGNSIHNREPSLYRVKILPENTEHYKKTVVTINPKEVKINESTTKHRNVRSEDIIFSKTKLYEDHLLMMQPRKSAGILHPKEFNINDIIRTVEPKSTASLQQESIFKNRSQPNDDVKITEDKNASKEQESKRTYNLSPKVKVAENKTINVKPKPSGTNTSVPVLKAKTRKPEVKIIKKAKTEGRIVREKPKEVESRRSTSELANIKASPNRSVEKIISKENLISEIEAWASNTSSIATKRKVKSQQEKVRPKERAQMRSNLSKRNKIIGKINAISENTGSIQKPLKTSQSEHVKAVLPETPTENNDSGNEKAKMLTLQERNENINVSVGATVGDTRRPVKKYPIDDDDKFMSVDKSLKRNAQRVLSDLLKSSQDEGPSNADTGMMNIVVTDPTAFKRSNLDAVKKKPYIFVTSGDEMRRRKKSELQRNTKKLKNELHARQQAKRFKKEVVDEMNDAADDIYQREKRKWETIRGTRRQVMRQKDVKVIQPSVGSGPWGTKIKKQTSGNDDDKKNLHDSTNIIITPSKEKLMSKSEFLKLKQHQENSSTQSQAASTSKPVPNLREIEFQQNIQEIQKYLMTKRATETEMELYKQQGRKNRPHEEARSNLTSLGSEIHKYLNEKNKNNENKDKNVIKGKDGQPDIQISLPTHNEGHTNKQEAKSDLYKRIDQEIEIKVKPRAEWPTNVFTSDTLNFKITKMAEIIANDLRVKEENERAAKVNENKSRNKEKQDITIIGTSPQVHSEDENRFASGQVKMWNVTQTPTEDKAKKTSADSVRITKKDFSLKIQSKNVSQSGQPARTGAIKGYSDMRRTQNTLSADDASRKSISLRPNEKLTSPGTVPNSFDIPSLQEMRKNEIEEMMEIKRKNKIARRIKTTHLKNMLHQPTHALNTIGEKSGGNADTRPASTTKENETERLNLEHLTESRNYNPSDKEETGTNIVKGPNFIFKPETLSLLTRRKPNIRNNLETGPRYEDSSKMPTIPCEKIVLPLQNPQVIDKKLIDPQMSTLDKPLMDDIKTVPKEILEAEEKVKKATQKLTLYGRQTDPLAKYRHLKITYMTVNRRAKKEEEKFLPALVNNTEDREMDEENKNEIINFRFELLKRLNEEFKQLADQRQPPPVTPKHHKTPVAFDSDKLELAKSDLEKDIESFTEINMNAAKILSEIKPVASLEKGLKNIKKSEASNKGENKKRRGTSKSNKTMFPHLKPDSNDENGPGDVRRYSTDSTKCVGSDSNDKEQLDSKCEKTDIWPLVSECTEAHSTKNQVCADAEDFDVLEAVPHAFACPSHQLEEHRQKDLYYRYHQMTFLDLHQYLDQKRAFAFKAVEKDKSQERKHKE